MISREEIQNLAELARLKLKEEEIAPLQRDISAILEYVEAVSTAKIPSGSTARGEIGIVLKNVMREDVPQAVSKEMRENLLAAVPRREGDYVVVRKVIDKQSE